MLSIEYVTYFFRLLGRYKEIGMSFDVSLQPLLDEIVSSPPLEKHSLSAGPFWASCFPNLQAVTWLHTKLVDYTSSLGQGI